MGLESEHGEHMACIRFYMNVYCVLSIEGNVVDLLNAVLLKLIMRCCFRLVMLAIVAV